MQLHGRSGLAIAVAAVVLISAGCVEKPSFTATTVLSGLDHPWEIGFLPDGTLLYTERDKGTINALVNGNLRVLYTAPDNASGTEATSEAGMLGLAVDPQFPTTTYIFACLVSTAPPGTLPDVRVLRFTANPNLRLTDRRDIVTGLPSTGRFHHGCRPRFGPDSFLYVTTGDGGVAESAQDLNSLGGKVLRVGRSGAAVGTNQHGRIFSYGHRNVQGIAFRESDGLGVTTEHGTYREDELNPLVPGNFGWDPNGSDGIYDESVPMTDEQKFPGAIEPLIDTGNETRAPSGATFVEGDEWGSWEDKLLVAMLKKKELLVLDLASNGEVLDIGKALDNTYGRLRTVVQGPDGALYISTDNGSDHDRIIRLTPN